MSTVVVRSDTDRVLAVIDANEGSGEDVDPGCNNDTIVETTGLSMAAVCSVLATLWKQAWIEGVLTIGPVPYLQGIRRVLPGRERAWGVDGFYRPRP